MNARQRRVERRRVARAVQAERDIIATWLHVREGDSVLAEMVGDGDYRCGCCAEPWPARVVPMPSPSCLRCRGTGARQW